MDTPIGGLVLLEYVCHNCELIISEQNLRVDFIIIDMSSFNVILGMDWLSAYQAFIDCFLRRVTFLAPSGDTCLFVEDHLGFSALSLHLLHRRISRDDYQASLLVDEGRGTRGEFPPVVCEFIDVFREDLLGLLPIHVIKFTIDLVPSTSLYSTLLCGSSIIERVEDSIRRASG